MFLAIFLRWGGKLKVKPGGEAWAPLRDRVESDTLLSPSAKSRILSILDNPSTSTETKKWRLRHRLGNDLWKDLLSRHFRYLRCFEIRIFYSPATKEEVIPTEKLSEEKPDTTTVSIVPTAPVQPVKVSWEEIERVPILAAGTNLLSDLALSPTLFIDYPIGKKWSIWGEYTFPWWLTPGNDRAWQILKWDIGPRYWFNSGREDEPMDVLLGHYLALDLAAGYYDIEPHHKGYQGEFQTAGLEYGYAWRIWDNWRLEAFVGVGWMGTHYRYYEANEGDVKLYYKHNGNFTWFGPTRLGINLKYVFHKKRRIVHYE